MNTHSTRTYKVLTMSEETYCEQCGNPIFEGETVIVRDDSDFPHFCSRRCVQAFATQDDRFPMCDARGFHPFTLES